MNFVNNDNHFKVVHVILSENKKSFFIIIMLKLKRQHASKDPERPHTYIATILHIHMRNNHLQI